MYLPAAIYLQYHILLRLRNEVSPSPTACRGHPTGSHKARGRTQFVAVQIILQVGSQGHSAHTDVQNCSKVQLMVIGLY